MRRLKHPRTPASSDLSERPSCAPVTGPERRSPSPRGGVLARRASTSLSLTDATPAGPPGGQPGQRAGAAAARAARAAWPGPAGHRRLRPRRLVPDHVRGHPRRRVRPAHLPQGAVRPAGRQRVHRAHRHRPRRPGPPLPAGRDHRRAAAAEPGRGHRGLRQVHRQAVDGTQIPVLTSRTDLPAAEVCWRLAGRWRQENYFKYARAHFALDALDSYADTSDDPTRLVPNPAKATATTALESARVGVRDAEARLSAAIDDATSRARGPAPPLFPLPRA